MANRNVEPTSGEIFVPGAAPGAPVEGQVYFDSTAHALKVYTSSAWQTSATSADLAAKADKATPTPGSYSKVTITSQGVVSAGTTAAIADVTGLQAALDGKVDENAAITGATNTKITYDSKGLVTSGAAATTADIADSTDKRYCTDAQKTVIGNTSGTNTGNITLTSIGASPNADGASIVGQVFNLQPASASFGGVVNTTTQSFIGLKSFTSGVSGVSSGTGGIGGVFIGGADGYGVKGYVAGHASGTNIGVYGQVLWGMGTDICIGVRGDARQYGVEGISNVGAGVYGHSSSGAGGQFDSNVSRGAIIITPSSNIPASPLEGDTYYNAANHVLRFWNGTTWIDYGSSGSGTGVTAIGAFGSSPCAEGGSIAGNTLTLQPASTLYPGGVLATAQTLYGEKIFAATGSGHTGIVGAATGEGASYGVLGTSTYSYGGYFTGTDGVYGGGATGVVGSGVDYGVSGTASAGTGVYGVGTSYGVEGFSTNNPGVYGHSTSNYGVKGSSTNSVGVYAVGGNYGIQCSATAGTGIYATGTTDGGLFSSDSTSGGHGVRATATGASGTNYGGHFTATSGVGLYGTSNGGTGYGIQGVGMVCGVKAESSGDYGVHATNTSTATSNHFGVYAECISAGTGYRIGVYGSGATDGVRGEGTSTGVYGSSASGTGVYGTCGGNYGVYGESTGGTTASRYGIYGRCWSSGGGIKCGVGGIGMSVGVKGYGETGCGLEGTSGSGFGVEAQGNATSAPLRLVGLASAPSSVVEGQIMYNSTDKHFYGYNGTTWKQLDN